MLGTDLHTAILIIAMSLVTILLRFAPFLIFNDRREIPKIISYLGDVLPSAVIGMLVIYCLRDINLLVFPYGLKELMSCFVVVVIQVFSKNAILSILFGTIFYMVVLNLF